MFNLTCIRAILAPKFHVTFNKFVPGCTWLICQVQKYIQVQKYKVQVQVQPSVTYAPPKCNDGHALLKLIEREIKAKSTNKKQLGNVKTGSKKMFYED